MSNLSRPPVSRRQLCCGSVSVSGTAHWTHLSWSCCSANINEISFLLQALSGRVQWRLRGSHAHRHTVPILHLTHDTRWSRTMHELPRAHAYLSVISLCSVGRSRCSHTLTTLSLTSAQSHAPSHQTRTLVGPCWLGPAFSAPGLTHCTYLAHCTYTPSVIPPAGRHSIHMCASPQDPW